MPLSDDQSTIFDRPVFVVGSKRSGTTWLQRILLSHPAACGGPESNFFSCFGGAIRSFHRGVGALRQAGLANFWTYDGLVNEIRSLWRRTMSPIVEQAGPGARLLVEKTPNHALCLAEIDEVLPECKVIHIVRDSRAVVASMLAASHETWGRIFAPSRAKDAAIEWHRHVREARAYGAKLGPGRYLEVRYEDLLADTAGSIERIYAFVGLPVTRAEAERIAATQKFEEQKKTGGTPFQRAGELASLDRAAPEPPGFFRKGQSDAWKTELSLMQKLVVWRYTRHLLGECGYAWDGPQPLPRPAPPPAARQPVAEPAVAST